MLEKKDFDRITYKKPGQRRFSNPIKDFIGIDSETRKSGEPFMICMSNGKTYSYKDFPFCLTDPGYKSVHFAVWNLKFDAGAILYNLTPKQKEELWKFGELKIVLDDPRDGKMHIFMYKYIPHKFLSIKTEVSMARFWEIQQFFNSSLNHASKRYLNKEKHDLDASKFTNQYIAKNFKKIESYCIQDCVLTREAALYFQSKLKEFGIDCASLYSPASISYDYFARRSKIVNVHRFWEENKSFLRLVFNTYQGGKFEVTTRGHADKAYEYDITSAYPYEISRLYDISSAKVVRYKRPRKDAVYSFYYVYLSHPKNPRLHSPNGIKVGQLRVYPMGQYYTYLTGAEYDYLSSLGFDIKIIEGYHLMIDSVRFPYRHVIYDLFDIKDEYKTKDPMLYAITKIMMNGFYGKMLQLTPDPKTNTLKAGAAWNPIYASIITANTRIKVTKFQNLLQDRCLAVHTDSIITLDPIDPSFLGTHLGAWHEELIGEALVIASGMYDMGDKTAYRGFEFQKSFSWKQTLSQNPNSKFISYDQVRVISWTQAAAWDKHEKTNVFEDFPKKINLNCDQKRLWWKEWKAHNFLNQLDRSAPIPHSEKYEKSLH